MTMSYRYCKVSIFRISQSNDIAPCTLLLMAPLKEKKPLCIISHYVGIYSKQQL